MFDDAFPPILNPFDGGNRRRTQHNGSTPNGFGTQAELKSDSIDLPTMAVRIG
jgi:hypothetical protein